MKIQQKFGVALVILSVLAGLVLQKAGSLLFRPDGVDSIEIVPAPPDLTPVLVLLSTNWMVAAPLLLMFVAGLFCVVGPMLRHPDEGQMVEIKYLH